MLNRLVLKKAGIYFLATILLSLSSNQSDLQTTADSATFTTNTVKATIDAGTGNDTFYINLASDVISAPNSGESDTIYSSVTYFGAGQRQYAVSDRRRADRHRQLGQ